MEQVRQIIVLVRISRDGNWELNREPFTPVMTGKRACLEHKYWNRHKARHRHRQRQAQRVIGGWKVSFFAPLQPRYAVVQNTTTGIHTQTRKEGIVRCSLSFRAQFSNVVSPCWGSRSGQAPYSLAEPTDPLTPWLTRQARGNPSQFMHFTLSKHSGRNGYGIRQAVKSTFQTNFSFDIKHQKWIAKQGYV